MSARTRAARRAARRIARPLSWLTAEERKAWLSHANDRAVAIARLIALCIVADDDGDETGGGGGPPVISDHMPASVNLTPCGS